MLCSCRPSARKVALQGLGFQGGTIKEANAELLALGRSGQLPWCLPGVREALGYISPGAVIVCPTHCLLHGVTHDFISYSVRATAGDTPRPDDFARNPITLSHAARRFVKVRLHSPLVVRDGLCLL